MKIKLLLLLMATAFCFTVRAQSSQPVILLSNYTFSHNNLLVGTITTSNSANSKFTLAGANASKFIIRGNKLYVKSAFNKDAEKWYDVTLKSGNVTGDFRIVNDHFIHNRVIAHRGAWKNTPTTENSITSLKKAIELGFEGSEFDVHMSSDSVMFIHHDPKVDSLTIEKTSSADLYKVKLSNGESLPTLEQYLKAGTQQNTMHLVLEIKPSIISKERAQALTVRVLNLVRKLKVQAWIYYISFDYDVCKKVLELDPYATVTYLNGDKSPEEVKADKLAGLDYHYSIYEKHPDWVAKALGMGLTINVWTVNDEPRMHSYLDQHVTFITTNEPEKLLEIIKGKK